MPIGTGQVIPQTVPLNASYSQSANACEDMFGTAVPRNPDGTVYDCTALTGLNLEASNGQTSAATFLDNSPTPTMISHDATGVYFKIAASDVATLFAAIGVTNAPFSLYGTDGTTTKLLAIGTIALALRP